MIGERATGQSATPPLEFRLEVTQRFDLPLSLPDALIEEAQEDRARHGAGPLARGDDELADLVQRETERLRLADEIEAMKIGPGVQAEAAGTSARRGEKAPALVEPEGFDTEP